MARIAKSLDVLRNQINRAYPNRSKVSDGWIGDPAHAARKSDHNPNASGVVTALDITHDPAHGVDTWALAEILRQRRDRRIKYVISNGRIFSSETSPWQWRPYTGANKHAVHVHVSVSSNPALYDDAATWDLASTAHIEPAPTPPLPKKITPGLRRQMMEIILGYEGRFTNGKLQVFTVDGEPEIAGITQKDHPDAYARLKRILDTGNQATLRDEVLKYYEQYTAPAQNWTDRPGLEFNLRDCILHRGPTGAAMILQTAVGVPVDGQVGPTTRGALAALNPDDAIDQIRKAREVYENKKYTKAARVAKGQWDGLVNRWNKAADQAHKFEADAKMVGPAGKAAGGIAAGGSAAVAVAVHQGADIGTIVGIVVAFAVIAVSAFLIIRATRKD